MHSACSLDWGWKAKEKLHLTWAKDIRAVQKLEINWGQEDCRAHSRHNQRTG